MAGYLVWALVALLILVCLISVSGVLHIGASLIWVALIIAAVLGAIAVLTGGYSAG